MSGLGLTALVGGLSQDQATEQAATEVGGRLLLGFGAAIVTIIAGSAVLARKAPRRWGVVLIVTNVVGLVAAGAFYLFGGILGLVAGAPRPRRSTRARGYPELNHGALSLLLGAPRLTRTCGPAAAIARPAAGLRMSHGSLFAGLGPDGGGGPAAPRQHRRFRARPRLHRDDTRARAFRPDPIGPLTEPPARPAPDPGRPIALACHGW